MGLFDKFKKKENNNWENAYIGKEVKVPSVSANAPNGLLSLPL